MDIVEIFAFCILIVACFVVSYFLGMFSNRKNIFPLVVISVVIVVVVVKFHNFTAPRYNCSEILRCWSIHWPVYNEATETIRNIIEGKNPDTSGLRVFLYGLDEDRYEYCCTEIYTLIGLLRNAYSAARNNKGTEAQDYLHQADNFLERNSHLLIGSPPKSNNEPDENLYDVPDPRKLEDNLFEWQLNN